MMAGFPFLLSTISRPIPSLSDHKVPEELKEQVKAVMKAAYKLPRQEGIAKPKKQAEWLCAHHSDATASQKDGS